MFMNQYNKEMGDLMKNKLNQYSPAGSFDEVWNKHQKKYNRIFGFKKVVAIPIIVLIVFITLFTAGFASYQITKKTDNTDYPFVNDPQIIGKWDVVDFVKEIGDFIPDNKNWIGSIYLSELAFIKGGKMLSSIEKGNLAYSEFNWTNGLIISIQEQTASKYIIKEIEGSKYMFFEWKSGDYSFRNMAPNYYVLKQVDNNDYSNIEINKIEDKTDYPFVNDQRMIGKWESVSVVKNIEEFKPGIKSEYSDIMDIRCDIYENGILSMLINTSEFIKTWTKGLILDNSDKIACKCEIKEINGDTYMFYEWKTGDYSTRGIKPNYYVLKKIK
jgi:bla regulator protein blaR1